MKIIKPKKRRKATAKDQKKEAVFRQLGSILGEAGFKVRREKLKQGHGWKVASGSCLAEGENFVFVESRLTQDDQIGFLLTRIRELEVEVSPEQREGLPKKVVKALDAIANDATDMPGDDRGIEESPNQEQQAGV